MTALKDRLRLAMDGPPKVTQGALAAACKVSAPSVNDWLSGKSQEIKAANLLAAAKFLRVSPDWLATGKGPMRLNDSPPKKNSQEESPPPSHLLRVDRVRMRDAIELLGYLAELQAVNATALTSDPEAIAIAYDYLAEMDASVEHGDILDITKRIAARIRGENDASEKRGETS